ncbi:MAG: GDSL-type esterase/lipase family protein [Bacteroidales bacterium]|jgi:lysophospholipase L1-like esterase|nr:GDSL-type esterase/lipase family protein [Bacteroidales bacterium]
MMNVKNFILVIAGALSLTCCQSETEPSQVIHNGPTAVFLGNSITEMWGKTRPDLWAENNYVCKGVSGQTVKLMLDRFQSSVLDLDPYCVVIMGGTNDLAHNPSFTASLQGICNILRDMVAAAQAQKIKVLLCSVTPVAYYPWNTSIQHVPDSVIKLNTMIKDMADRYGCIYVDYHSALKDVNNGLKPEYKGNGDDEVHLSPAAYEVIEPIVNVAIKQALGWYNNKTSADKNALNTLISECDNLLSSSQDNVTQQFINEFTTILNAVKRTAASNAPQAQIDAVYSQLSKAKALFETRIYADIPAENVLLNLSFDEGNEGTTQLIAGGKNLICELVSNSNSERPQFVQGHKGKSIKFHNGNFLKIENYQRLDFEGSELSFAVWLKPTEERITNYVISCNGWNSWKLQLTSGNQTMFTVTTVSGVIDMAPIAEINPLNAWTHVIVSLNLREGWLDMYASGRLLKRWTKDEMPKLTGEISHTFAQNPITIGIMSKVGSSQDLSTYFEGEMDELKVYNTALTGGQATRLFKNEK